MMDAATRYALLSGAGLFLLAMCTAAWMLLRDMRSQERYGERIRQIHGEERVTAVKTEAVPLRQMLSRSVSGAGQAILNCGLVPAATRGQLEAMLRGAGVRGEQSVGVFFGAKMLAMTVLPVIAWLVLRRTGWPDLIITFVPIGAGVIGLLLPDMIVKRMRKRYMGRLEKGLPDALDMMVICAQAGLGLGPAVIRVADEMKASYRDLAIEFSLTANELQIMSDTRIALHNLGQRSGLEAFRRLAMTLIQTIQYGTPLTDALRTLSAEMRQEALTAFEESAARLPTMLTLPMIIFILPCVFLIAGGPAIIQVMRSMGG
ncbi:MAG: type II secretion system F family protein [Acetobacteraceae bacterium]|nr:type II secretion system F family protein [Acetobacteraceae bacterium]